MTRAPRFTTQLYTVPRPDLGPGFNTLTGPLRYESRITGRSIIVPRGFPTDLASFRIGDLRLGGMTDRPAVVHDLLYASGECPKLIADIIFFEACRAEGLGRFRAGLRLIAVVASPAAHRAWRAHRRGTTPGAKFCRAYSGPKIDSTTNHP